MQDNIGWRIDDGVVVLTVDAPPFNRLTAGVRAELASALNRAASDDRVRAVVLAGAQGRFPANDETQTTAVQTAVSLSDLCAQIERMDCPVVAALQGAVLGDGAALALACHARVAEQNTRFGLPEVKLGLVPPGGATQRLPRLVGAQLALDVMLSGRLTPVADLPGLAMIAEDAVAAATIHARTLRDPSRTRDIIPGADDPQGYQAAILARRQALSQSPEIAPSEIIDCVEAAQLMPFDAGLAREEAAAEACATSHISAALRHAVRAERRSADFMPQPRWRPDRLLLLGAGPLSVQLALTVAQAGMQVLWWSANGAERDASLARMHATLERSVEQGRMEGGMARASAARVVAARDIPEDADVALVAARGQHPADILPETLRRFSALAAPVDKAGLRFARPAHLTRLVEVTAGPAATPAVLSQAHALALRLGKVPVLTRSPDQSLSVRMLWTMQRAADGLVDRGASPFAIDAALMQAGFAQVPFETRDLAGLTRRSAEYGTKGPGDWSRMIAAMGRPGRAGGAGFYDYPDVRGMPQPSADVLAEIDAQRAAARFAPETITALMLGALANEGLHLLDSGMARQASDIDVVMMLGHGMARWSGGPMKAVGLIGLLPVMRAMERLGHPDSAVWQPHRRWAELIKDGQTFDGL